MTFPRSIAIATLLGTLLAGGVAATAFAQPAPVAPAPAPTDDARTKAQDLMKQGNDFFEEGSYVEALEKFRAAYDIFPSPKLLLNIGTTLRLLGRNSEAATTYDRYLRDPGRDPGRVVEVQRILADLDAILGHLRIYTATQGARVTIDGNELGNSPVDQTLRVEPGPHKVVAEKPGMQAFVTTATLKGGESATVQAEPTPPGVVTNTVTVETGKGQRIAGIVVGSVGVASAIVGGVFGGLALQANGDAAEHCSSKTPEACDATGVELGATASQRATISTVMLSVGGAAVAGGVILFFTAPSKKSAPKPATALTLGARTTAAGIDGGVARLVVDW